MTAMQLIGLNTKYYRYKYHLTQEQYANMTKFKMAYISTIETGDANLTCKNIDLIATSFGIKVEQLFQEETAKIASSFPSRIDMYHKIE
ncbi:MAG: helix-turn-helix transcriptional regulator [Firmicutes bacterium]|nr:helix-turn-helix transcriptional regulator [Bacillota bacterium]